MTARHREAFSQFPTEGWYAFFGGPPYVYSLPNRGDSKCDDIVGHPEDDNPLDLFFYESRVPGLYGKQIWGGTTFREVSNWPIDFQNLSCDPRSNYPLLTSNELNNYAWQVVARTNPSKPTCSVPTMIGELKDVPDLVLKFGRGVIKDIANANLWWRFGVKPLIGDLKRLAQFTKEVNNLLRAIRKLQQDGYITRRCPLGTERTGWVEVYSGYLNTSTNYYLSGKRYLRHTFNVWGSCRWKAATDFDVPASDEALEKELRLIIGGLNPAEIPSTVWELIPWSWLIDWFWSIQDFLSLIHNELKLDHEGICIMRTTTAKSKYDVNAGNPPQYVYNTDCHIDGKYHELGIRKERYPTSLAGVPTASIPAISPGQWSILGSLAALRMK